MWAKGVTPGTLQAKVQHGCPDVAFYAWVRGSGPGPSMTGGKGTLRNEHDLPRTQRSATFSSLFQLRSVPNSFYYEGSPPSLKKQRMVQSPKSTVRTGPSLQTRNRVYHGTQRYFPRQFQEWLPGPSCSPPCHHLSRPRASERGTSQKTAPWKKKETRNALRGDIAGIGQGQDGIRRIAHNSFSNKSLMVSGRYTF